MNKKKVLLENEFNLVCDCLNGILFESSVELGVEDQQLVSEIECGINLDCLDIKWRVDSQKLIEKLKNLSVDESFQLVEKVYKFWNRDTSEIIDLKLKKKNDLIRQLGGEVN